MLFNVDTFAIVGLTALRSVWEVVRTAADTILILRKVILFCCPLVSGIDGKCGTCRFENRFLIKEQSQYPPEK